MLINQKKMMAHSLFFSAKLQSLYTQNNKICSGKKAKNVPMALPHKGVNFYILST